MRKKIKPGLGTSREGLRPPPPIDMTNSGKEATRLRGRAPQDYWRGIRSDPRVRLQPPSPIDMTNSGKEATRLRGRAPQGHFWLIFAVRQSAASAPSADRHDEFGERSNAAFILDTTRIRAANRSQRSGCGPFGSPRLTRFGWDLPRLTGRAEHRPKGQSSYFLSYS